MFTNHFTEECDVTRSMWGVIEANIFHPLISKNIFEIFLNEKSKNVEFKLKLYSVCITCYHKV